MSEPTYHRHLNEVNVHADPSSCGMSMAVTYPVAVVDVREGSEDMERLVGLLAEVMGITHLNAAEVENLTETVRRYAAGESAEPEETYCLLDGRGNWRVSDDPENGWRPVADMGSAPRPLDYIILFGGIDPGVIRFQPGQRVRHKGPNGAVLIVTQDGFLHTGTWRHWEDNNSFTSEYYELVDGGDA